MPLVQQSDLPVRADYIEQVTAMVDSVTLVSRWFNMLCVHVEGSPVQISALTCVKRVERPQFLRARLAMVDSSFKTYPEALKFYQTERMEASVFREHKIDGEGIVIAIIDAGFTGMHGHKSYEHMQVLKAWDFVRNDDNPYRGSRHGAAVAACIGGKDIKDGAFFGLAPKAQYLLARSERELSENAAEEEYWLAAAEWADKNGADVINSSLGYTQKRYQIEDMNGKTALVSRAAKMAFRKGIVVVVSAGNEGDGSWKYISAPADVDSVIAVGGVDPKTDAHIGFSSLGPNANYVPKPNVSAYGSVVTPDRLNGMSINKGTSFASPLVAGFVACMLQVYPDYNQHQLFRELQNCGHLYPYFDFAHGYGIPQASALFTETPIESPVLFNLTAKEGALYVELSDTFKSLYTDEKRLRRLNIYAHVKNSEGRLVFYACYRNIFSSGRLLDLSGFEKGNEVMVHFEGYSATYTIQE